MKQSLLDFHIGYWGTMVMGILFLTLGAFVIYGTGTPIETSAGKYANQFISIFTASIGPWVYWFIAIAAFATMFSTTITCFDALPRVMESATKEAIDPSTSGRIPKAGRRYYWFWMLILFAGVLVMLGLLVSSMKHMVTIATAASFLVAPVHALINYLVITGKDVPKELQPDLLHHILCWFGLAFLTGFGVLYVWIMIV